METEEMKAEREAMLKKLLGLKEAIAPFIENEVVENPPSKPSHTISKVITIIIYPFVWIGKQIRKLFHKHASVIPLPILLS